MPKGVYDRCDALETKTKFEQIKALQNLSLPSKIEISKTVIQEALNDRPRAALLFSGGKMSAVLYHMFLTIKPDILHIYNETTLTDARVLPMVKGYLDGKKAEISIVSTDVRAIWAEKNCFPLFSKRGFTGIKKKLPHLNISPVQCSYNLKDRYSNHFLAQHKIQVSFWGNTAGHSFRRLMGFVDNGFMPYSKQFGRWNCYPLQHWSKEDAIEYLKTNMPEYPLGLNTNCLPCGVNITQYPNHLSRFFLADRERWEYYMHGGYAQEILKARGLDPSTSDFYIHESPETLLRINFAKNVAPIE